MTTTTCPHTEYATRVCPGCTLKDFDSTWRLGCDGEISAHVYQDSDGDAGVINGTRSFTTVEDLTLNCRCILTHDEEQHVIDVLCEAWSDATDDDYYGALADARSY